MSNPLAAAAIIIAVSIAVPTLFYLYERACDRAIAARKEREAACKQG